MDASASGVPLCVELAPALTVGQAMDAIAEQSLARGLHDTAQWLSELALSATPAVLSAALSFNSPLCEVVRMDQGIAAPQLGRSFGSAGTHHHSNNNNDDDDDEAKAFLADARRYHRMGLSLFLSGEYMRCHTLLLKAMREIGGGGGVAGQTHFEVRNARHSAPWLSAPARGEKFLGRPKDEEAEALHESPRLGEGGLGASFKTTRLPSCVVFLCLYAFYMDGQKYKHTNSPVGGAVGGGAAAVPSAGASAGSGSGSGGAGDPPHRAMNPHLRVLRALLLEALRNEHFYIGAGSVFALGGGGGGNPTGEPAGVFVRERLIHASVEVGPSTRRGSYRAQDSPLVGEGGGGLLRQDPYLTWLMGVVLRDLGMRQESATYLLASVCVNPLLWMAWQDLETLVNREAQLEELRGILEGVEPEFMVEIFLAHVKAALGVAPLSICSGSGRTPPPNGATSPTRQPELTPSSSRRVLNTWQALIQEKFPRNLYLRVQLASYYCHQRKEMERAEHVYGQIHSADPYRMDFIVDYSNVLFMKSDTLTLSSLAQKMYHADPFRAESNFVVGNYYVLLKRHERGVLHFRRATAIRPDFVAAWTLLGHAYVETKNTTAAIEAYRTVVALDERDYRGWYNLGQIYELLQAYHHALFYYWHAASLRPTDPRMWIAVSECLDHEGRLGESITCLERAEAYEPLNSDVYPNMVRTIGNYYIGCKNFFRACIYLEKLTRATKASEDDLRFVLPFLTQYYVVQAQQEVELLSRGFNYETATGSTNAGSALHSSPPRDRADFARVQLRELPGGTAGASHLNPSTRPPLAGSEESGSDPRYARALSFLSAAETHMESFASLMQALGVTTAESDHATGSDPLSFSPARRAAAGSKPPSVRKARHGGETAPFRKYDSPILSTANYTAASSAESTSPATVGAHAQTLSFLSRMRKEVAAIHALIQQRTSIGTTTSAFTKLTGFF